MNKKDYFALIAFSLFLGVLLFGRVVSVDIAEATLDSIENIQKTNVKNKTALFIGDSHTANHAFGWQKQLCDSTGMKIKNRAQGGKTTDWMLNETVYGINAQVDYMFIYGGANDMYNNTMTPVQCLDNIQRMVNAGVARNIKVVVLTGFDPVKCVATNTPGYKARYAKLQELMLTNLQKCKVVDVRSIVTKKDCADAICHMHLSGHKKIAKKIIQELNLKTI